MKKAVTLCTLADQDWKTQLAQGYSNIPVNAVVEVIDEDFNNFYGSWCIVKWSNHNYYVSKKDLSFNEIDIECAEKTNDIEQYRDKFNK